MRSCDYLIWDVVEDGPSVPIRKIRRSDELEPKQKSEWTNSKVKKIQINFKAINTLYCAYDID